MGSYRVQNPRRRRWHKQQRHEQRHDQRCRRSQGNIRERVARLRLVRTVPE